MRAAKFLTALSILLLCLAFSASAQKKRKPVPRPTPRPTPTAVSPIVAVAKLQVSNQLHNVNVFIDRLGPIAVAIESVEKDAVAGKLKKEAMAAHEANKKRTVAAIRGLREGLVALETDFRTKPQLSRYLHTIQGITDLCARSEDSAIAGRFVASKDPLRQIALKLNEVLAVLPGPTPNGVTAGPVQNRTVSALSPSPVPASNPSQNRTAPTTTPPVTATQREPVLGMTTAEVLLSSWGKPIDKRTSGSSNGTTEVWVYSGNRTLYFFNGKLANIIR
jgi:hypothetical protein